MRACRAFGSLYTRRVTPKFRRVALIGKLRSGHYDRQIKAVAFVSNEVSRHTVLPVLACSEIVMANDPENKRVGSIGDKIDG